MQQEAPHENKIRHVRMTLNCLYDKTGPCDTVNPLIWLLVS